jgi:hypothetical protein
MAQTNYTPISLYYSTTASAVPTAANLVPGELAINTNDGKLYYEDSSGVVQVLATKSTGSIGGSNTQVQFNNSGSLGGSSGLTWDGSFLTTSSIKNTALTSGRVTLAGASGLLADSANLTFDGTMLSAPVARIGTFASFGTESLQVAKNNGAGAVGSAYQFAINSKGANNRAEMIMTDGSQANAFISYVPSATPANDVLTFALQGSNILNVIGNGSVVVGATSILSAGKVGISFNGATSQGLVLRTSLATAGSTFVQFENSAGTTQGYITALTTTTTSYVGTSDQRLKENIVDAPSFLSVINNIKVRQFDWKETGETDIGFIAQELHTTLPKAVAVGIDNADGSIQLPWGVDKSAIVPYLVKAIQELKAEFDAYKATHP